MLSIRYNNTYCNITIVAYSSKILIHTLMMCSTAERRGGGIRHASSPFVRQGSLSMDLGATQSIFSRAMDVKLKFSPIYIGGG